MKGFVKFLWPLIIPITVLFVGFYLNQQKADVRFLLYESVPTSISGTYSTESIQQVLVSNMGNIKAEKIIVAIKGKVNSCDVVKYSQSDSVQQFSTPDSCEVVYPELPPQGNFRVIVKSQGNGIKKEDITVKHSKGLAIEALTNTRSSVSIVIFLMLFLGYLYIVFRGICEIMKIAWERQALRGTEVEKILRRDRHPFCFKKSEWNDLRKEAIDTEISSRYFNRYDYSESPVYKILSIEKPDYMSEVEWLSSTQKATKVFHDNMKALISEALIPDEMLNFLRLERPKNFSENYWSELRKKTCQKYIILMKSYSLSIQRAVDIFKTPKPPELPELYWEEYIEYLKCEYMRLIIDKVYFSKNPMTFVKEQKLDFLDSNRRDTVLSLAYQREMRSLPNPALFEGAREMLKLERPNWITDSDYNDQISQAKKTMECEDAGNKLKVLENIVKNSLLPTEKPNYFNAAEWDKLNRIHIAITDIEKREKQNEENLNILLRKESEIGKQKEELEKLKAKIIRQLTIINAIFTDYRAIDRIEEYEDAFAKGNFENLKRIANIIKKENTKGVAENAEFG